MNAMQVISVFHKKIHPETSIAAREFVDSDKYKLKNAPHGGYKKEDKMHLTAGTNGPTLGSMSKMGIPSHKTTLYPTNDRLHGSNLRAKEHWIKTDVDCKYRFIFFPIKNIREKSHHVRRRDRNILQVNYNW